jgi:hypothetical protein
MEKEEPQQSRGPPPLKLSPATLARRVAVYKITQSDKRSVQHCSYICQRQGRREMLDRTSDPSAIRILSSAFPSLSMISWTI